jgi:hypothetical protein
LNGRGDMDGLEIAIREIRAFGRALSIHDVALGTGPVRGRLDELRCDAVSLSAGENSMAQITSTSIGLWAIWPRTQASGQKQAQRHGTCANAVN